MLTVQPLASLKSPGGARIRPASRLSQCKVRSRSLGRGAACRAGVECVAALATLRPPGFRYSLGSLHLCARHRVSDGRPARGVPAGLPGAVLLVPASAPWLAGAVLMPFVLKPHLFIPFVLTLIVFCVTRKQYRFWPAPRQPSRAVAPSPSSSIPLRGVNTMRSRPPRASWMRLFRPSAWPSAFLCFARQSGLNSSPPSQDVPGRPGTSGTVVSAGTGSSTDRWWSWFPFSAPRTRLCSIRRCSFRPFSSPCTKRRNPSLYFCCLASHRPGFLFSCR